MVDNTYLFDLDAIIGQIMLAQTVAVPETFSYHIAQARALFSEVCGVSEDGPLLVFGEQADPPIIKNLGKSVLAEMIRRRLLDNEGVDARLVHMVLTDDIFGSDAEVFDRLGLVHRNLIDRLGAQTYACAPVPGKYVVNMGKALSEGLNKLQFDTLIAEGLGLDSLVDLSRGHLGSFNMEIRRRLEARILPFNMLRTSFTTLEREIIRRGALHGYGLASFLQGSNPVGYVTWKTVPKPVKDYDSGYRRHNFRLFGPVMTLSDSVTGKDILSASAEAVLQDERCAAVSLNAGARARLMYLLTYGGAQITGGGSTYNAVISAGWAAQGFPRPVITYIADAGFKEGRFLPISRLLTKRKLIDTLVGDAQIKSTTDSAFKKLVER